jgi:hypothetical protein
MSNLAQRKTQGSNLLRLLLQRCTLGLVLLSSLACKEAVPIAIKYAKERDAPPKGTLRDPILDMLEEKFQMAFEQDGTNVKYGVLMLKIVDIDDGVGAVGYAEFWGHCRRTAYAVKNDEVIAHEVGHMLGLEHRNVDGNLMHPGQTGADHLTEEQLEDAYWNASAFVGCRP